jgi:hypothetical protein
MGRAASKSIIFQVGRGRAGGLLWRGSKIQKNTKKIKKEKIRKIRKIRKK